VITSVDFSKRPFIAIVDEKKQIIADSVIIATGASARWLGIPSEQKFSGSGVSACATCDGFFYKGQDVAVVGGGDTAAEEATYLANLCKKVYLIVRRDALRACKTMQQRVVDTKNIEVLWNHVPKEITGNKIVEGVTLTNTITGEEKKIEITGFFVAIGHHPNSEVFKEWIDLDINGYIKTVPGSTATNVKGVFAAGDVQDHRFRQAVTAAGSGCMAALEVEQYLLTIK
jgi:thioredoxin reductase (NADPH)